MNATKLSPGAYAVLGLLSREPTSGYELGSLAERTIAHFWPITRAHIYAELGRLEDAGLVTATEVSQRGRPDKRVYAITEQGERALDAWLETADLGDERRRHPLLLKVFFGDRMRPDRLAGLLAAERERYQALRERYLAVAAALEGDPHAVMRRATVLYGVRCAEAQLAWLDEVEPMIAPTTRSV
jgi:PadR family transcriptional regulator, regulatory protein AphA